MDSQSPKAHKFVAIGHFHTPPRNEQDLGKSVIKSVSIDPETTVAQVFAALWPKEPEFGFMCDMPFRIELVPDEAAIPPDPKAERLKGNGTSTDPDPIF